MTARPHKSLHAANSQVLDVVGPPGWRDMKVLEATLHLNGSDLPTWTLRCHYWPLVLEGEEVATYQRQFRVEPVGLDLDAMEQEARARVAEHVEAEAERHLTELRGVLRWHRLHEAWTHWYTLRIPRVEEPGSLRIVKGGAA